MITFKNGLTVNLNDFIKKRKNYPYKLIYTYTTNVIVQANYIQTWVEKNIKTKTYIYTYYTSDKNNGIITNIVVLFDNKKDQLKAKLALKT